MKAALIAAPIFSLLALACAVETSPRPSTEEVDVTASESAEDAPADPSRSVTQDENCQECILVQYVELHEACPAGTSKVGNNAGQQHRCVKWGAKDRCYWLPIKGSCSTYACDPKNANLSNADVGWCWL